MQDLLSYCIRKRELLTKWNSIMETDVSGNMCEETSSRNCATDFKLHDSRYIQLKALLTQVYKMRVGILLFATTHTPHTPPPHFFTTHPLRIFHYIATYRDERGRQTSTRNYRNFFACRCTENFVSQS